MSRYRSTSPSIRRLGTATALAAALVAGGCFSDPAVMAERSQPAPDVVATVGGEKITKDQVEERMASQLMDLDRQRHDLINQGLEALLAETVLELEAAERSVTTEELLAMEVESKSTAPSDAEVDAFYEARKAQIQQPKEQVAPRIREFLESQQQQQLYTDLISRLREKHGVATFIEPYRVEVAADGAPAKGPESAPVTIVEFSDFECPFCSRVVPTLDRVTESYGDKVRLVFRQFPLHSIHPNAQKAAEASLCAHEQDSFWKMHDTLFQEQKALAVDQLKQKAARLELDTEAFNECLDSGRYAEQVAADVAAGAELGVSGTPAIFINGRLLSGAQPYEAIAEVIDEELARAGG